MASDQNHAAWLELRCSRQHMPQQSAAREFVQHFGQFALHAGAFARSHDHDV